MARIVNSTDATVLVRVNDDSNAKEIPPRSDAFVGPERATMSITKISFQIANDPSSEITLKLNVDDDIVIVDVLGPPLTASVRKK